MDMADLEFDAIELENVHDLVEEQFKLAADDAGVDWEESYEDAALEVAKDIIRESVRHRNQLIAEVNLCVFPWEEDSN